jgi:hypothetical protein
MEYAFFLKQVCGLSTLECLIIYAGIEQILFYCTFIIHFSNAYSLIIVFFPPHLYSTALQHITSRINSVKLNAISRYNKMCFMNLNSCRMIIVVDIKFIGLCFA